MQNAACAQAQFAPAVVQSIITNEPSRRISISPNQPPKPAAVYDAAPAPRAPADIIHLPGQHSQPRQPGPAATAKWLTASVTNDIAALITAGFDEAKRGDPHHQRTWEALVDGNPARTGAITAQAQCRHVTVHVVCDFIHLLEYLWKAAWSFFEPGDPDAGDWVTAPALKILTGKAAAVAAGIRRRATTFGYADAEREGLMPAPPT